MLDFGIGLTKAIEDSTLSTTEILYAAVNGKVTAAMEEDENSEKRLLILEDTKSQDTAHIDAALQSSFSEADNEEVEDNELDDELGQVSKHCYYSHLLFAVYSSKLLERARL